MVLFTQGRTVELCKKQTFKTCQFNEKGLLICQLKSERNYSEKKHHKNASFMVDALKTRGNQY